jgi:hypothetical protein
MLYYTAPFDSLVAGDAFELSPGGGDTHIRCEGNTTVNGAPMNAINVKTGNHINVSPTSTLIVPSQAKIHA